MSPEKVTLMDRDGWNPINLHTTPERRRNAEKAIEYNYKELGINFNFQKLTFLKI